MSRTTVALTSRGRCRADVAPGVQVQRDTRPGLGFHGADGSAVPSGLMQCAQRQRCSAAWTDPAERVMPSAASAARTPSMLRPPAQRSWWTRRAMCSRSAAVSARDG
jgi:hypothetical protein